MVNIATARNIFCALKESLAKFGLDFSKAVSFMSDTASVMKGCRSGVQKLIKNEMPHLYDAGCICHLADLTSKAGIETLPVNIDQLFIDIFYHFYHSSKRSQQFADHWCSLFTSEPKTILKHCPTRWLSLLRCVGRYIEQLEGLKSYFLSCDEQSPKVISITERLENPLVVPILHFLAYILPKMDTFSRLFQKSIENTTCELYSEMNRLVRLYAGNVLKTEVILAAGDNLKDLKLDRDSQVSDEYLGIGTDTWACIGDLEKELDPKPFFSAVRSFYLATIQKMLKKFPFGDPLFKDLGILLPSKVSDTVIRLAKRFPQLGLSDSESISRLQEEFMDFILSPADLPSSHTYNACDHTKKESAGSFWFEIGKMKTFDGQQRFSKLYKLMAGLLSIPSSNADAERGFSILRKIHTDQRPTLLHSTIVSLLSLKYNNLSSCFETSLPDELISKCKKATSISLGK